MSRPEWSLQGIGATAAFSMRDHDESEPVDDWGEEGDSDDEDDWDEDDWDDEDERDGEGEAEGDLF